MFLKTTYFSTFNLYTMTFKIPGSQYSMLNNNMILIHEMKEFCHNLIIESTFSNLISIS